LLAAIFGVPPPDPDKAVFVYPLSLANELSGELEVLIELPPLELGQSSAAIVTVDACAPVQFCPLHAPPAVPLVVPTEKGPVASFPVFADTLL
jgi:hypothetical protein